MFQVPPGRIQSWTDAFFWLGFLPSSEAPDIEQLRNALSSCSSIPNHTSFETDVLKEVSCILFDLVKRVEDENSKWIVSRPPSSLPLPSSLSSMVNNSSYCVFDTETSGISLSDCALQMAVGFFADDGSEIGFYENLWKLPRGVKLNARAVQVHGISKRKLEERGVDPAPELRVLNVVFASMRKSKKRIVAHNASFDVRILSQTALRHGVKEWGLEVHHVFCTMKSSKFRCGLIDKAGRLKNPKNQELYYFLTGKKPEGALHDAKVDVRVTARSFEIGKRRGFWA